MDVRLSFASSVRGAFVGTESLADGTGTEGDVLLEVVDDDVVEDGADEGALLVAVDEPTCIPVANRAIAIIDI